MSFGNTNILAWTDASASSVMLCLSYLHTQGSARGPESEHLSVTVWLTSLNPEIYLPNSYKLVGIS
jgi:hypothetical protein